MIRQNWLQYSRPWGRQPPRPSSDSIYDSFSPGLTPIWCRWTIIMRTLRQLCSAENGSQNWWRSTPYKTPSRTVDTRAAESRGIPENMERMGGEGSNRGWNLVDRMGDNGRTNSSLCPCSNSDSLWHTSSTARKPVFDTKIPRQCKSVMGTYMASVWVRMSPNVRAETKNIRSVPPANIVNGSVQE